ncbi:quercetin 2,3-dioxygenase [Galbitalea soli]|uniref:Cupin domain-containing protein n=1 Tax=Galbitalea soli TaxID=1268042 RepID=A0A7C9PPH1_9MICO|nr:quercetin 2,3-dioxygenase [Galbitalea soli]NEM92267.1 cupin domain-containing protein [Galbitalea soli]NYJ31777.1 quercetin 2,3-dioxygenase [Galbitalea soli]
MTHAPAHDTVSSPFEGILPGAPLPYFLRNGEGEKSIVFDTVFDILLSADETEGQYGAFTTIGPKGDRIPAHQHPTTHEIFYVVEGAVGLWLDDQADYHEKRVLEAGDFAFVPKGIVHAYQNLATSKIFGVGTGGFERFFHGIGTPTDSAEIPTRPYIPPFEQMLAAGQKYGTVFLPEFSFRD